ncbi:hypothetical protein MASR2M44_14370 [Bacteroidota bacterium]
MKVLITGVGGPTPRSIAIALKKISKKYPKLELIATDNNPFSIGLYQRDLFSKSYLVPHCGNSTYWEKIEEIVSREQIALAIIQPELEVVEWCKKAELGKLPCPSYLPALGMAELLINKGLLTAALKPLGRVPESITFSRSTLNQQQLEEVLGTSYWVRSTKGTSGLGSLHIKDAGTLVKWLEMNAGVEEFIASTFLPGRNLATKMLYWNGELLRSATGERVNYIMSKIAPSGITGNTSFGRLLNEPELIEMAKEVMDHLFMLTGSKPHGFFTIDWKEDGHGNPFVTEINVRHVAFTQCFAAAGANFAELSLDLMLEGKPETMQYAMYEFEANQVFLRDVDCLPILMKEHELMR